MISFQNVLFCQHSQHNVLAVGSRCVRSSWNGHSFLYLCTACKQKTSTIGLSGTPETPRNGTEPKIVLSFLFYACILSCSRLHFINLLMKCNIFHYKLKTKLKIYMTLQSSPTVIYFCSCVACYHCNSSLEICNFNSYQADNCLKFHIYLTVVSNGPHFSTNSDWCAWHYCNFQHVVKLITYK